MKVTTSLWLIGCGNMGGALRARWHAAGFGAITVVDPVATPSGVTVERVAPATGVPDILILAVKPQVWRDSVAAFAPRIGANTLVVSIMAGVTIAALRAAFPDATLVRAMPNTPARIGQGVTALFTTGDSDARAQAEALFAPTGATVWLDAEADFDAVTGLSGSGPAYVFAMIEALAHAGTAAGLSPALAEALALATVTGAAALAAEGHATPAELRTAVTSPNGTTAAGLAVLQPQLEGLMVATVAAAAERSRALV